MPQYHVDSERISNASIAINNTADQIRSAVTVMYSQLSELEGSWQGTSANQFSTVITDWRNAQNSIENSLQSIQQALSQAAVLYSDAETQAGQLFMQ
ncbi:WXG100 family type VII secretion target [Alloscardovia theropitheci]|uniref:ESAT-6-like protein n=1 Tax=Alloscardovia theropitheci TaxID=2496842 RepID=A0A4R0QN61_9BIFI|nr:WXG100 family type VII secretion target [Alloscardovia theropitheci]TCD53622.1 WXG100 family type VII secretion target [Alloscardovia theropitheci]